MSRPRLVGYVRVSTDAQADGGVSLDAQRAKLDAYALALDLDLVAVVVDAGVSAKTLDRPGLREALGMLDSGAAEGLLVAKLDRLTRSVRDLGDLVERYFAARCSLLSVSDSIDTRSAAGRLVLNLLASVAQWELETISERTRAALAVKRARGERVGECPYGYRAEEGRLVADEREQAVIWQVRALRAEGRTLRAIVAELDANGVRSRGGKPLGLRQVHALARCSEQEAQCQQSPTQAPTLASSRWASTFVGTRSSTRASASLLPTSSRKQLPLLAS